MKYYITTAIDYTNSVPHLGHAYEKILADVIARWHRLRGDETFFSAGTDEHGQKVEKAAKAAGIETQKFVDTNVKEFKKLIKILNISNDAFIRTTEEKHKKISADIFKKVFDNGDIYKGEYEGMYCEGCEAFYTETQLEDGCCPVHKKPPQKLKEESYFFKMSKYEKQLIEHIEKNPNFILPTFRQKEILNRLKEGLTDLSVSRTSFDWGIQLPNDEKHVIYVWFDALINYLSVLDYPDGELFKKFWPADCHMIGKDITWFHTVIWPTMLMAAGIELPKTIFNHGFINLKGEKLSKSRGIIVDPIKLTETYGADPIRYVLTKEIVHGQDGDFSEDLIIEKINNELADDLGNLLMRIAVLTEKNFEGKIPEQGKMENVDDKLVKASDIVKEVDELMLNYECHKALEKIWSFIRDCNKYLNETEPWKQNKERNATILYNLVESLRIIGILLQSFIPETASKVLEQIGQKQGTLKDASFTKKTTGIVKKSKVLFPKIEIKEKEPSEKFDLRVAEVTEVEDHPKADKLYVVKIDVGGEKKQLCAGLKGHLEKDEIINKKIVVVYNLKPAKLRGIESQGMLLAAEKDGKVKLVEAIGNSGDIIVGPADSQITIEEFAKQKFEVKNKKVLFNDKELSKVKADIEDGAEVR